MFDIEIINTLSELVFERPVDFILTGLCVGYMIWFIWFAVNDDEVR
tara:strand:+ start:96 stop:233 length:138 start_codon:yes stop_codon:yes gene_type:complete